MLQLLPTQPENQALKLAMSIDSKRVAAITTFANSVKEAFRDFWFSSTGISPQQICDAFGTNASTIFIEHAEAVAFLLEHGVTMEEKDYIPPRAYVVNNDGTVTIN